MTPKYFKLISKNTCTTLCYYIVFENRFIAMYPMHSEIIEYHTYFEITDDRHPSTAKEVKECYQSILHARTVEFHELFTPSLNDFIHEQLLRQEGY